MLVGVISRVGKGLDPDGDNNSSNSVLPSADTLISE